jgi:hypothetical protein
MVTSIATIKADIMHAAVTSRRRIPVSVGASS